MKSDEQHLNENELERVSQQAAKWFEKHGMKVVIGVCAVAIVAAIVWYVSRSMKAAAARGWTELRSALVEDQQDQYPNALQTVAKNYPKSAVGAWALLHAAEMRLERFAFVQFDDRGASDIELSNEDPPGAEQQFRAVLVHPGTTAEIRERALYGLATTLETLSGGDTKEALETYRALLNEFPESVYKVVVERRIEELEKEEASEFYAWFRNQNPNPDDPDRQPQDGGTSTLPDIPMDLRLRDTSTASSDDSPGTGPSLTPNDGSDSTETSDDEKPSDDSTSSDSDSPKPDDTKPTDPDPGTDSDDGEADSTEPAGDDEPAQP